MSKIDISKYSIEKTDDIFTFKNENTTLGFVRFNSIGEVEYIFVNPLFKKQDLATKLLKLVKDKTKKNYTSRTYKSSRI